MSQASFAKRQREKARQEKAAAKAERRAERQATADADSADAPSQPPVEEGALLDELASLHARFENGDIDFDDFLEAKDEITQRLRVE